MKIIVLNGSPRPNGNTIAMIEAYMAGARSAGHERLTAEGAALTDPDEPNRR